jgi:hypothetical protein
MPDDLQTIVNKLKSVLDRYELKPERIPAILGDGAGNVGVIGREGYVHLRLPDGSYYGAAFNNKVALNDGADVVAGYSHEEPTLFQVLSTRQTSVAPSSVSVHTIFVPLSAPLTSTSWDGDARSTTAKTLIDLSAVFGVPAGIKAVLCNVHVRDSGSDGVTTFIGIILAPNSTSDQGISHSCNGVTNDAKTRATMVVPCDSNGDIYYQTVASGAGTLDVVIEIWGYWI